jgi:hypothetical protein
LEEQENQAAIKAIQHQYHQKQVEFDAVAGSKDKQAVKQGEVSTQIKIEYMLRFFCHQFLDSTFPFIPVKFLKDLMVK